jgi:hypothetical protein
MLLSALVGACTGEGGGLPSGTPLPSRSGEIALPSEPSESEPSPTEAPPTEDPSPTKTREPEPSPTEAPPTDEPSPTTAETTVPPASEGPTPGAEGNKNKDKEGKEDEEQTYRWLVLLLLVAITVGLIVLSVRRRRSNADRAALAGHAYRSCSALRDRLAQELTTSTGVPWTQLLPLVDGAASTLYPLQTSPPDQQAALAVTHAVEAVSAVRVALQAGATTPTPSDEAKASLLRALGQLDTALEPLRFEATGRSGPGPVTSAGNG